MEFGQGGHLLSPARVSTTPPIRVSTNLAPEDKGNQWGNDSH
jgi:hypothetical protein